MSSTARYTTFDPADRFSWPSEEVAQRLTSAWLLECCCSRSCYPWKRRSSRYGDKSGSVKDTKKDEKKFEGAKSLEQLSRDSKSDSEESPLYLTSVKNYQGKNERDEGETIFIKEGLVDSDDADDEENDENDKKQKKAEDNEDNSSETKNNDEKSEFKTFNFFKNKPIARKYSLDISARKKEDKQFFRKYSLDTIKVQKLEEARNKMKIDDSLLHIDDYIEPDGSPVFKRCVSFRNKSLKSKKEDEGTKSLDLLEEEKVTLEKLKFQMDEEKNLNQESEKIKKGEDQKKKGLFDSDSESDSEESETAFEFANEYSSNNFELRKEKDLEDKNHGKIKRQCRSGIFSVLPEVRETEEEVDSSHGIGIPT